MVRKDVECFDICCFVVVVVNVGDNGNDNEIYALVTITKWYAHSFNHLCIDKMPLVIKRACQL